MRSTIICVDDDRWLIEVLSGLLNEWLGKNYIIEKAMSGKEALDIIDACLAEDMEVSLIIADYIMPGMKGDELLEQVKIKTPMTRRIMLTGFAAIEGITNAINKAGIYRFLSKPWDNKDMMLTVIQAVRSYEQDIRAEKLAKSHQELYQNARELANELQANYKQVIAVLSSAVEIREGVQRGHSARVAKFAAHIARDSGLPDKTTKKINTAALLHDIGKLGLNDEELSALRGSGCYTKKDMALRQAECAKAMMQDMDNEILNGVIYHTERVDGQGPYGLYATEIPVEAKIIGLCNYYDIACTTLQGDSHADVIKYIAPDKGKIFDEKLYNVLANVIL